jgi:hypothetical protein
MVRSLLDARQLSEQPAGTLAQGAKLAAGLNDQERVVWNRPTGGVAAFATMDRKPHQNFPFSKAHRTYTVFHWFAGTESASLWRIRRHSGTVWNRENVTKGSMMEALCEERKRTPKVQETQYEHLA